MKTNFGTSLLTALSAIVFTMVASARTYTITDIGLPAASTSLATGINAAGQVSGFSTTITNSTRAWRYTPGVGTVDLGTFGGADTRALSLNNAGQVSGYSTDTNGMAHGFIFSGGGLTDIGGFGAGADVFPQHINAAGQVAGFSFITNDDRPFLYTAPNTFANLGTISNAMLPATAAAYGMNDAGRVVGIGTGAGGFNRAFRTTTNGMLEELGTLGGDESWAYAINNSNQIAGSASFVSTDTHAFLFSDDAGMTDLGTLGGYTSTAFAVDNGGNVVGTAENANRDLRAFAWSPGSGMQDLNQLIPVNSSWVLTEARGINDAGQITGNGLFNGLQRAFLLTPNSGPDTNPPVAILTAFNITNIQAGAQFMQITFWDDTAVLGSSIATNSIRVTGPNGFNLIATLYPYAIVPPYGLLATTNAIAISANFYILPPSGLWNGSNNGVYSVAIEPNTVSDTNGNFMPAGVIGTFTIASETKPVVSISAAFNPVMNATSNFTLSALSSFPYDPTDVFNFTIDWNNDGTDLQQVSGTTGVQVPHAFSSIGAHTIRVSATDLHGVASANNFTGVSVVNPPLTIAWTAAPVLTGNRHLAVGVNSNGTLFCLGGLPLKSSKLPVQSLAPGAALFTDTARITGQTIGPGAGMDALNRIIVFGGIEPNSTTANLNGYVYLPATGNGPAIAAKHYATHDFAFCADNLHRLYSIGGAVGAGTASGTNAVERYDAIANSWTTLAPMPVTRINATATYDGIGHILVMGGVDPATATPTTTVYAYDIATDTWLQSGNAPNNGANAGRVAQLGADGLVYLIGGMSSAFVASGTVYMLDPALGEWFSGPNLTVGRGTPAVALGDDGFIYAMGGDETSNGGGNNNGQSTVDKLDTITPHVPRIVSSPSFATVQAESPFSYQITATGHPRPTYSLTSGPAGMTINTNTGVVLWTPTTNQVGVQSVTVRASSTAGVAEQVFTLTVTPLPLPPGDVTPPTAPASISLVFRSATSVTLTWPAATDDVGVVSYSVYGLFRGSRSSHIGLIASGITNRSYISHSLTTLYYVAAVDAAGNRSALSTPVSGGVLTLPVIGPVTFGAPPTVIQGNAFLYNISATANPSAGFNNFSGPAGMTFTHVAGPLTNADYVVVQWQPAANQVGTNTFTASATNANTTGSSATFTVVVLPNGTDFIPPTPVAQMIASGIAADHCNLTWTPAGDNIGVVNYHLVATHFGATSNHVVMLDVPGTNTSTVLSGLLAASGYTVVITPSDAANNVGSSTSIFLTTLVQPNAMLRLAGGQSPGTLALNWNGAGSQWKYTVESSDSLDAPNWTAVTPTNQWPSLTTNLIVTTGGPLKYFRVKATPAQP